MTADPTAAFTSEYVCNNLARKAVRELGQQSARNNASRFNETLLLPVAKRLITAGRCQRGEIGRMTKNLVTKLKADKCVVSVEHNDFTKKLSSNEEHRLTYVLAVSEDSDDWLDFVCNEIRLRRKEIDMNVCVADVRIHRHALSRYMQRELRSAERMLEELEETLHMSSLLGAAAASVEGGNIAIPLKNGMLFGRVHVIDELGTRMILHMDKHGPEHSDGLRHSITKDARVFVELLTYVDGPSLGPVKERLCERVNEFVRLHKKGAKAMFDASYYTCSVLDADGEAGLFLRIADAINAATDLVQTREWQAWVDNVGAGR